MLKYRNNKMFVNILSTVSHFVTMGSQSKLIKHSTFIFFLIAKFGLWMGDAKLIISSSFVLQHVKPLVPAVIAVVNTH
jgi:hypothetical protein